MFASLIFIIAFAICLIPHALSVWINISFAWKFLKALSDKTLLHKNDKVGFHFAVLIYRDYIHTYIANVFIIKKLFKSVDKNSDWRESSEARLEKWHKEV